MTITFLGTGTSQGVPIIGSTDPVCLSQDTKDKRLRSSIMITWGHYRYIIDCGPDFRQQMLRENVTAINGIIFTHEHSDHTAGLDDIRAFSHKMGEVPLYVPERMVSNLEQRFQYIFTKVNRYPGAPSAEIKPVKNETFAIGNKQILPVEYSHGKLLMFGYRIDDVAYLTDFKSITDTEKEKLQNLNVLILSALRIELHPTHLNLEEALAFIEDIKPKKAYLTHISHKLGFHAAISKQLPENVELAYDGLKISI